VQKKYLKRMGIFGANTQTIAISQAANGKSTADVEINVPVWEVILIAFIVSTIVYFLCNCITSGAKKQFEKSVQRYQIGGA
jgi:hypothetical protein